MEKIPCFEDSRESLLLKLIRQNGGTQSRAAINFEIVQEYVAALMAGDRFPPIIVYFDGAEYWLADGFHRLEAYTRCQQESIPVTIRQGTRRDAVLHSVGANSTHGLRRTNADKRRAVEILLLDEEWGRWSDREIARRCGVSNDFVGRLRASLSLNDSEGPIEQRQYVNRYGQQSPMNVKKMSNKKKKDVPPPKQEIPSSSTNLYFRAGDTIELLNPPSESGWSPGDRATVAEVFQEDQTVRLQLDNHQNQFAGFSFSDIRLVPKRLEKLQNPEADELRKQVQQLQTTVADLLRERERLRQEADALKKERQSLLNRIDQLESFSSNPKLRILP